MNDEERSTSDGDMTFEEAFNNVVITEEDLTAERLTDLFRHKRVLRVEDTDGGFRFIFRDGNMLTVDPSAGGEIWGETVNKYMWETERGPPDTEGLSTESVLELGDLVRLKDPYESTGEYIEYTHGIVVEILGTFGGDLSGVPDHVSLHLYNPQTREMYFDVTNQYGSPTFVDQHIRNLVLVQKASDSTYHARDIDIAEYIDLGDRW